MTHEGPHSGAGFTALAASLLNGGFLFGVVTDWGIRPHSKTHKFPFSDRAFVTARKVPY